MARTIIVAWIAALVMLGCSDLPDRPLADGYTLHGLVLDAATGVPVSGVDVLVGLEHDLEFHPFTVTDANGRFLFQPSPNTAPSREVFRFQRTGYTSMDVLARTATRVEEYRYRLEARLQPEPTR